MSACAFGRFAGAAEVYPVTDADRKFLAEIIRALEKQDTTWVAGHVSYPLSVTVSNRTFIVKSQKEFTAILKRELTTGIRTKIVETAKQPLFKNWQRVMVGNGLVWFTEFKSDSENSWRYVILAFGGFAFQPKDSVLISP